MRSYHALLVGMLAAAGGGVGHAQQQPLTFETPADVLIVDQPEPPLPAGADHLLAYMVKPINIEVDAPPLPTEEEVAADPTINPFDYIDANHLKVKLKGEYDTRPMEVSVRRLTHTIIPADKRGEPISGAGLLTSYQIEENWPEPVRTVRIRNRFGEQELSLGRPVQLLVPACRSGGPTAEFDHYKCFLVLRSCLKQRIKCCDPYGKEIPVTLTAGAPKMYCVPVAKLHDGSWTEITEPQTHLTFYGTTVVNDPEQLDVTDQFRAYHLEQRTNVLVGVPTYQISVFPPLPRRPQPAADDNQAARVRPIDPQPKASIISTIISVFRR